MVILKIQKKKKTMKVVFFEDLDSDDIVLDSEDFSDENILDDDILDDDEE